MFLFWLVAFCARALQRSGMLSVFVETIHRLATETVSIAPALGDIRNGAGMFGMVIEWRLKVRSFSTDGSKLKDVAVVGNVTEDIQSQSEL